MPTPKTRHYYPGEVEIFLLQTEGCDFSRAGKTASKREAFTPSCGTLALYNPHSIIPEKLRGNTISS